MHSTAVEFMPRLCSPIMATRYAAWCDVSAISGQRGFWCAVGMAPCISPSRSWRGVRRPWGSSPPARATTTRAPWGSRGAIQKQPPSWRPRVMWRPLTSGECGLRTARNAISWASCRRVSIRSSMSAPTGCGGRTAAPATSWPPWVNSGPSARFPTERFSMGRTSVPRPCSWLSAMGLRTAAV